MESLDKKIRDTLQSIEKMIEESTDKEKINEKRELLDKLLDEYLEDL